MNKGVFFGRGTLFVLLFSAVVLFSAGAEKSVITFSADRVTASVSKNKKTTNLLGNAAVKVEALELFADKIEIFGEDYRFVYASGSVKGEDKKNNYTFKADLIKMDRKKDLVLMFGKIELSDTKNDVKISAENIEFDKAAEIMIMRFSVNITNKDIVCSSISALYNRKNSSLELTGLPSVKKGGDEFKAARISVNLDTEDISLDGRVSGTVHEQQEAEPPAQPAETETTETDAEAKTAEPTAAGHATPPAQSTGVLNPPHESTYPDVNVGVCRSHKVVAVGFNTLCYDAEHRGINPSARIKERYKR